MNDEMNNLNNGQGTGQPVQNMNPFEAPIVPQNDYDDIEVLDFDDDSTDAESTVVTPSVPTMEAPVLEPERMENITPMSSIPSIEDVLGESVKEEIPVVPVQQPQVSNVVQSNVTSSLPPIEDVLGVSAEPVAPVMPEVPSQPVDPMEATTVIPSIDEMFGTSTVSKPAEQPQETPFTAVRHGVFGGPEVNTPVQPAPVVESVVNEVPTMVTPNMNQSLYADDFVIPASEEPSFVEEPKMETPAQAVNIPPVSDIFGIATPQVDSTPVTPVVETPSMNTVPEMEPTPVTFDEKEEKVVEKLENTDMTPSKEEKKEELENTILLNKQLNDAQMAIKAEEAKKDPEKKNQKGIAIVILLFTILIFAVVIIPFIFQYLNK